MARPNNIELCSTTVINQKKVNSVKKLLDEMPEIQDIADMFKILGDPTRLKIIIALQQEELCVCDLAALLNLTLPAISHQLRLLKGAKLVKFRREGKMVYYSLDDDHIRQLIQVTSEHVMER